jgi:hypothetical protein
MSYMIKAALAFILLAGVVGSRTDRPRRWTRCSLVAVLATLIAGCGMTNEEWRDSNKYEALGMRLLAKGSVALPGAGYSEKYGRGFTDLCIAVFESGKGLYYIRTGFDELTLYKPGQGIYANLRLDVGGDCLAAPLIGTGNSDAHYYVVVHPSLQAIFDNVAVNPTAFLDVVNAGPPYFESPKYPGYRRVSESNRKLPKQKDGHGWVGLRLVRDELLTLTAVDVAPNIATLRNNAYASEAKAKADAEAKDARAANLDAQRRAAASRAAALFGEAAQFPKSLGQTVCSADNRIAQVEQVSGGRIQLSMRGRALGQKYMDEVRGPFKFGAPWTSNYAEMLAGEIVADPHFLFQGFPDLKFARASGSFWDEARYWGVCNYRIS